MKSVRFVLFDAVGTLIFPRPSVAEVYAAHGKRFGSRLTAPEIKTRFRAAIARTAKHEPVSEAGEFERWRQIVREIFDDVTAADDGLFTTLWQHFAEGGHWAVYDDVPAVWQGLTQGGFTLGIASNFDARLHNVCRHLPPLDVCTLRFVSSEVGFAKPDPRFFTAVAERLSAAPQELLLVGDDPRFDDQPARAAGWQALQIDRDAAQTTPGVIHDLRELLPLLAC